MLFNLYDLICCVFFVVYNGYCGCLFGVVGFPALVVVFYYVVSFEMNFCLVFDGCFDSIVMCSDVGGVYDVRDLI